MTPADALMAAGVGLALAAVAATATRWPNLTGYEATCIVAVVAVSVGCSITSAAIR